MCSSDLATETWDLFRFKSLRDLFTVGQGEQQCAHEREWQKPVVAVALAVSVASGQQQDKMVMTVINMRLFVSRRDETHRGDDNFLLWHTRTRAHCISHRHFCILPQNPA